MSQEDRQPSRQEEDDQAEERGSAAAIAAERKEPLWVLERADTLLSEIAAAIWLSVASVWRIPRAVVARDSMVRLATMVPGQQVLPPRMSMLVASIASALLLARELPDRTPHQTADSLLGRLTTTSPESWLLVAAPALISLWVTVISFGGLLGPVAGAGSNEPTTVLMQTTSSIAILNCLGVVGVGLWASGLNSLMRGLPDVLLLTGFWLMIAILAIAGWRCAHQLSASSGCSGGDGARFCSWDQLLLSVPH